DHDIERCVVEPGKPALEIALDDVDAIAHAREHARVVDLDAVAARASLRGEIVQQRAVAATQVEHVRAVSDPASDRRVVGARDAGAGNGNRCRRCNCGRHGAYHAMPSAITPPTPISVAIRSNHVRTTAWYCGLSSRNASWPWGAAISAYETSRRSRTSAFTISRERDAGKRQSVVNDTTRKRQVALASARARSPPVRVAGSK